MTERILIKLLEKTASVRLGVVILVLIIAASIAGTGTAYDVYHSWWFAVLLGMFGANLVACTALGIIRGTTRVGSLITHIGILVVLAGVIAGSILGTRGILSLEAGEVSDAFTTDDLTARLPFKVRLEEFRIDWDRSAPHLLHVGVMDAGVRTSIKVEPGSTYDVPGTDYRIEVSRFVADLLVDREQGIISRSDNPANPAMLLLIHHAGETEKRWVFSAHPEFSMSKDGNIDIIYRHDAKPLDFASRVTILDRDGSTTSAIIKVNQPKKHRGWSIYQTSFDIARPGWTGLEVVYDPGVAIVFLGIALMNLGVFLVLHRRFSKSATR